MDLLIEPLNSSRNGSEQILKMLCFDDHLLRRFGQLDLVRRMPGAIEELKQRAVADEIWFLIEGKAECLCRDLRPGSPSQGFEMRFQIVEPTRMLIPFGVAFGWQSLEKPALMLRCSTHQDGDHPEDLVIPAGASG